MFICLTSRTGCLAYNDYAFTIKSENRPAQDLPLMRASSLSHHTEPTGCSQERESP